MSHNSQPRKNIFKKTQTRNKKNQFGITSPTFRSRNENLERNKSKNKKIPFK